MKVIPHPKAVPQPDLIETLKELLADAKAGRISGLAYATEKPNGNAGSGWTTHRNTHVMMSAVAMLQHRITRDLIEQSDDA